MLSGLNHKLSSAMNRLCLHCSSPIKGRADKKFCSDYCRNAYHNVRNRNSDAIIRQINYVLKKNRRILAKYNTMGQLKIRRSVLRREGFDFDRITSLGINSDGITCYFCYEMGYMFLDDESVALLYSEVCDPHQQ